MAMSCNHAAHKNVLTIFPHESLFCSGKKAICYAKHLSARPGQVEPTRSGHGVLIASVLVLDYLSAPSHPRPTDFAPGQVRFCGPVHSMSGQAKCIAAKAGQAEAGHDYPPPAVLLVRQQTRFVIVAVLRQEK